MTERAVVEVAIFTENVEAVKRFYSQLLAAAPETEWPGGAIFSAGAVEVLVHERAAELEGGPANEDHFAIGVSDVDATCDDLRAQGVTFVVEARDYPWGRSAYLRDPDGRFVELLQT